ncbi:hypothetical protein MGYG_00729 [Nannizzia gypsea CBS 118893]|uniref:Endoplasmic reticulum-Golgi intermediate compartment protein n=1 Tax=Arthroderma gypseum (strain ATCC MYA-4604 / CBS 118893) TaxID=535722 RepID=E5R1D9_ARTGP|nr:hypothetical protein MGYG_00729 [Nannizzia gypsea CBS 118893]EFQ97690.1 hypothetical protein MGYG_00729 [Nannizzia gypsea CBS 118893]
MNGFAHDGLDEANFGAPDGIATKLKTFDAFPKTKPSYTSTSRGGGLWTIFVAILCTLLTCSELITWYRGHENHHFSVERGVSQEMQLNIDTVVAMPCDDVRINIQDAAGDHILAGDLLTQEPTSWAAWNREMNKRRSGGSPEYQTLNKEDTLRLEEQEEDLHVEHVLGEVRRSRKKKFPKAPKMKKSDVVDSCRVFGSLEGNKVQGNLHITARGFGYFEWGRATNPHSLNFTHLITELSFGPHYGRLLNPLDKTVSTTSVNFYKYQYHLSVVPTIYTKSGHMDPSRRSLPDSSTITAKDSKTTVSTNQYAVTSYSQPIQPRIDSTPGIFFKYNIEPILLIVSQERDSLLGLMIRLVNVVSGVLVTGGWLFQIGSWAVETMKKRRRLTSDGLLTGKHATD